MRCEQILAIVTLAALVLVTPTEQKKFKEGECEVCVTMLTKFIASLDETDKASSISVEKKFKQYCKTAKGKEERLCYYVGGAETSATYILPEMAKPISWGMPAEKVCEKLNAKDSAVCELRTTVQRDLSTVDLNKLKVKELKQVLNDWGEDCLGCSEKIEFVKRVQELMPKYKTGGAAGSEL